MSEPPERKRSTSRSRTSRPTTPLRPSSRSSFRDSAAAGRREAQFPLNAFEPAFAELSDAMADLEANMMHFQLMHESVSRFSESFASFLYGLNMNAFCVDFPEAPVAESFRPRHTENQGTPFIRPLERPEHDAETTFMTTDTTFVDNPSAPRQQPTRQSQVPTSSRGGTGRGRPGSSSRGARGGRQSGLAKPRVRGLR